MATVQEAYEFTRQNLFAMGLLPVIGSNGVENNTTSNTVYFEQIVEAKSPFLIKSSSDILKLDWSFNTRVAVANTVITVVLDVWSPISTVFSVTLLNEPIATINATDSYAKGGQVFLQNNFTNQPLLFKLKFRSGTLGNAVYMSSARLFASRIERGNL
jgi:hypothetical protein